jgi:hypothetical protein
VCFCLVDVHGFLHGLSLSDLVKLDNRRRNAGLHDTYHTLTGHGRPSACSRRSAAP